MANISTSSIFNKKNNDFYSVDKNDFLFTLPFSEQDVLELQGIFVALGVHIIRTKNVLEGRTIIQTILNSLNYYHNIGCITNEQDLPVNVCDIINHIKLQKSQHSDLLTNLEDFFSIHPCFDFVWIEFTKDIKNNYSQKDIKNLFDMYHVEERMPVVIVMYDDAE